MTRRRLTLWAGVWLTLLAGVILALKQFRRSVSIESARSIANLDVHGRPLYVDAVLEKAISEDPSAPPEIRELARIRLGIWVQGRIRDLVDPEVRAGRILWDPDGFSPATRLLLHITGGFDQEGIALLESVDQALLAEIGVTRSNAEGWFLARYGEPYEVWDPGSRKAALGLNSAKLYAAYNTYMSHFHGLGVAAISSRRAVALPE